MSLPSRAGAGGPAVPSVVTAGAALVSLGLALACAWRLWSEPRVPADDGRVGALVGEVERLARRLETIEHGIAELEAEARLAEPSGPSGDASSSMLSSIEEELPAPTREELAPPEEPAAAGEAGVRRSERAAVRSNLARLAGAAPEERLAVARELAESDNPVEQLAGARVLAELAPAEAYGLVDGWLAEALAGTRGEWFVVDAARALEEHGDPRCMQRWVDSLKPGLASDDVGDRRRAIFKLGTTRSASVTPLLASELKDADAELRLAALDALRTSGDATAIAAVTPLLDDPVGAVRDRATRTLDALRRREQEVAAPASPQEGSRDRLRRLLRSRPR
jgi:hypothetical protein